MPGCDSMKVAVQRVGLGITIGHVDIVQAQLRSPLVGARFVECVVAPPLLRQCPGHVFVAYPTSRSF